MSRNGSFAANRALTRHGPQPRRSVPAATACDEHARQVLAPAVDDPPAPARPVAGRVVPRVDMRTLDQVRTDDEAHAAAVLDEFPDDIPEPAPPTGEAPASGDDGDELAGFVVLDLTTVAPLPPHVLHVGDSALPSWCGARTGGVRWACGWWTDDGPVPAKTPKASAPPPGTPVARYALPSQAAGHWSVLHGQQVAGRAWVLALDAGGDVVGVFHRMPGQVASLLALLGVPNPDEPDDEPWTLTRTDLDHLDGPPLAHQQVDERAWPDEGEEPPDDDGSWWPATDWQAPAGDQADEW